MPAEEAASSVAYHARIRIVGSQGDVQRHRGLVDAFFAEFVSQDNFPDGRMREEPGDILAAITNSTHTHETEPEADAAPAPAVAAEQARIARPPQPATFLVCLELAPAVEISESGEACHIPPLADDDDNDDDDGGDGDITEAEAGEAPPTGQGRHHRRRRRRAWRFAGGMVVEHYPVSACALLAYLFVRREFRGPLQITSATPPSTPVPGGGPQGAAEAAGAAPAPAAPAVSVASLERPGEGQGRLPYAVLLTTAAALMLHGPEGMQALVARMRRSFGRCNAVLFEANHPSRTALASDSMPPHKRMGFYRRMGARQLPLDYIQPPLHDGAAPVRSMLLGCFPQFQADPTRLSIVNIMRFLIEFTASTDLDHEEHYYAEEDILADLATIDRFELRASQGLELSTADAAKEYRLRYRTAAGVPLLQEMWQGLLKRRGGGSHRGPTSSTKVALQAFGAGHPPPLPPVPQQAELSAAPPPGRAAAGTPVIMVARSLASDMPPEPSPAVMLGHLPITVEQARLQDTFLAWQFTSLEALGRTGIPLPLPPAAITALGAFLGAQLEGDPAGSSASPGGGANAGAGASPTPTSANIWLAVSDTLTLSSNVDGALAEALCALEADTVDTAGMLEPNVCHGRVVVVPACLSPAEGGVLLLPQPSGSPDVVATGGPPVSSLQSNPLPVFVAAQLAQLFNGSSDDAAPGDADAGAALASGGTCRLWLGPREDSEQLPRGVLRSLASIVEGAVSHPAASALGAPSPERSAAMA